MSHQLGTQNKANHVRLDPLLHFIIAPSLIIVAAWSVINAVRSPGSVTFCMAAIALILPCLALKVRQYPLKVQDRVIRLEERLRLATLLPERLRVRVGELSESQLIAIRFAPDAELESLVGRVLAENLDSKQIKASIQSWRGDYFRV